MCFFVLRDAKNKSDFVLVKVSRGRRRLFCFRFAGWGGRTDGRPGGTDGRTAPKDSIRALPGPPFYGTYLGIPQCGTTNYIQIPYSTALRSEPKILHQNLVAMSCYLLWLVSFPLVLRAFESLRAPNSLRSLARCARLTTS